MRAGQLMTRDVYFVDPTEELPAIWEMMKKLAIRHVPVVESGKPIGMVSDRDVLLHAAAKGTIEVPPLTAAAVMTKPLVTCLASASLSAVGLQMLSHKIDSVVIVSDDRSDLVGLLTSSDFIHLVLEREALDLHAPPPYEFHLRRLPR